MSPAKLMQPGALLPLLGLITMALWAAAIIPRWRQRSQQQGGTWSLEALLLIHGPVAAVVRVAGSTSAGGSLQVGLSQLVTLSAVAISIVALFSAMKAPRKNVGALLAVTTLYYAALLGAAVGAVIPALPQSYWMTPLFVLPFVLHGGFTVSWLVSRGAVMLRILIVLSLASAILLPQLAFNTDQNRVLFGFERLQGIVGHPNGLAILCVMGIFFESRRSWRSRWLAVFALTLVLTQSRTAVLALALALLVADDRLGHRLRRAAHASVLLATAAFLVVAPWRAAIGSFLASDAGTLDGRTAIWRAALHGYELNRLFGYGPTLLDDAYRARYLPNFAAAGQAHNQFVQALGSSGLIGLAALALLLAVLIRYACRARGLALSLVVCLLATCITETPLRPSAVGGGTFLVVLVLSVLAASSRAPATPRRRAAGQSAAGLSTQVPAPRHGAIVIPGLSAGLSRPPANAESGVDGGVSVGDSRGRMPIRDE